MSNSTRTAPPFQEQSYQAWLLHKGTREQVAEWCQWNDPQGAYTDAASDRSGLTPLSLRNARDIMRNMLAAGSRKAVAS